MHGDVRRPRAPSASRTTINVRVGKLPPICITCDRRLDGYETERVRQLITQFNRENARRRSACIKELNGCAHQCQQLQAYDLGLQHGTVRRLEGVLEGGNIPFKIDRPHREAERRRVPETASAGGRGVPNSDQRPEMRRRQRPEMRRPVLTEREIAVIRERHHHSTGLRTQKFRRKRPDREPGGGSRACAPARRRGGPPPTSESPQRNTHRRRERRRRGKEMAGAHSGSRTPAKEAGEAGTAQTQGGTTIRLAAGDRFAHAATRPSSTTFRQLLHVVERAYRAHGTEGVGQARSARVRRPAVCSFNNFQQRQHQIDACAGATKVQRRTTCGNEHHATVGSTASGQSDRPAPERAHRANRAASRHVHAAPCRLRRVNRNQSVAVCRLHCVKHESHESASGAQVPAS